MPRRFTNIRRIGPVRIGSRPGKFGRTVHVASCTAPRCGWSAEYATRNAADLAASTHRCSA